MSSVIDDIHTSDGTDELREIFGYQAFDFPKPTALIERFIEQVADGHCLVLDSFAGSGTTGHAAMKLKASGLDCQFILVEMDREIARNITSQRLRKALGGYEIGFGKQKGGAVDGLGSGFRYCELGKPLFDEWGAISQGVTFADLAAFVYFSDTGSPIPRRADASSPLIGTFQGRAIYLLFAATSAGVSDPRTGNTLTVGMLSVLPQPFAGFSGPRVVYGEGCTVPAERLAAEGVFFKQVPYQLAGA